MLEETPRKGPVSSPGDVLRVIWRCLWIIVLVALVLTGSALGFSLMQEPVYGASILIVVGQGTPDDPDAELRRDIVDGEQLVATVARTVDTLPVAQGVVERLNLPEGYAGTILKKTDVGTEPGTTFVEVSYRDTDPERAQRIANAIGETFSGQVSELNVSATPVTAQVWQGATLPGTPVSSSPLLNAALALMIGAVLGIGLAYLLESLDYGRTPDGRGRTGAYRGPRFRYNPAVRGSDEQKGKQ